MYIIALFVSCHYNNVFLQIDYFGLQYVGKDGYPRWVDRDKSLRKQLEKYHIDGARNAELRFYVQFYVTTVTKLEYEITRFDCLFVQVLLSFYLKSNSYIIIILLVKIICKQSSHTYYFCTGNAFSNVLTNQLHNRHCPQFSA